VNFNDDNTLEDILSVIAFASGRARWPDEVSQATVDEIVTRIQAKLQTTRNRIRRNWFERSREHAVQAAASFGRGDYVAFENELRRTEEYLREGNKAHRRKARFLVDTDGGIDPIDA